MLLLLLAMVGDTWAQARYRRQVLEPQWLRVDISQASTGFYMEGDYDTTSFGGSDPVTYQRLFIGPTLAFTMLGSVYHPNLLQFQIVTDGAFGYDHQQITAGDQSRTTQENWLGNFSGNLQFLPYKPFSAKAFASYTHNLTDYDFFNRVTVNIWSYGGSATYSKNQFEATAGYLHLQEETVGFDLPSSQDQDQVNVNLRHQRESGGTSFGYTWTDYHNAGFGLLDLGNTQNYFLGENDTFGDRKQFNYQGNITFNDQEIFGTLSRQLAANSTFTWDHRPDLQSLYDIYYDRFTLEDFTSRTIAGGAQLKHQLYESLTSVFSVAAADSQSQDDITSGYNTRYGGGLNENYTKRLGPDHQLNISASVNASHVEQKTGSQVINEPHSFDNPNGAPPGSFFLNQTDVIESTILITDQSQTLLYVRGVDYGVLRIGSQTAIQRLTGSRIGPAQTVLVDYRAVPSPEGSYEQWTQYYLVRVGFWNNLLGVFGRYSSFHNNAPNYLRVLNTVNYAVGADINWKWLRAGFEAERYTSTDSEYSALSAFESASFLLDGYSSLSVDFIQSWITYTSADRTEQNYRFIGRYHRALAYNFGFDLDAGVALRYGEGVDQTVATVRPAIQYVIGRTTISAGYNFEYEMFLNNEERFRNMLFVKCQRAF